MSSNREILVQESAFFSWNKWTSVTIWSKIHTCKVLNLHQTHVAQSTFNNTIAWFLNQLDLLLFDWVMALEYSWLNTKNPNELSVYRNTQKIQMNYQYIETHKKYKWTISILLLVSFHILSIKKGPKTRQESI